MMRKTITFAPIDAKNQIFDLNDEYFTKFGERFVVVRVSYI